MRKTRLFRSHEQAELVGAIADTRAMFFRIQASPSATRAILDVVFGSHTHHQGNV
jgi:hypothetical protein